MNIHLHHLRKGKHSSRHLQRAWDKYGPDQFECRVLEECRKDDRIQWEQQYIDLYHAADHEYGYNINPRAEDQTGRKWTAEQRERQSQQRKGFKHSEASKQKRREAWVDNREEWQANFRTKLGRSYDFVSPTGERVQGSCIAELAERYGLNRSGFSVLMLGKIHSFHGWTRATDPASDPFSILDPWGVEHSILANDLYSFCRTNDLPISTLKLLLEGKRIHCKGWSRPESKNAYVAIQHVNGEKISVLPYALEPFRKRFKVSSPAIRALLAGEDDIAEGWCLPERVEHYRCFYRFYAPDGALINVAWKGLTAWAAERGLDYYPILNVARGRRDTYNGYRRFYDSPQKG